jgi:hypothetical protein
MGKRNKAKGATVAVQAQPAGAAGTTAQAAQVLHLQVKQGVALRGARAAWYAVLVQHNGQPAAAYLAACKEKPPSVPKSGVAEAPQGWLSWFVRQGIAQLVPAAQ